MSLLSEIKAAVTNCGLPVETGVFSDEPPEEYVVVTPLADTYELHADNLPEYETQEARLSLFSRGNYLKRKKQLSKTLLAADLPLRTDGISGMRMIPATTTMPLTWRNYTDFKV